MNYTTLHVQSLKLYLNGANKSVVFTKEKI